MSSPACGANPHLLSSLRLREHSILPMVSCTMLIQTSSLVFVHGVPEDTHISTHLGSDDIRGRPDQIYAIFAVHFERAFSKSVNVRIMFLHVPTSYTCRHSNAEAHRRTSRGCLQRTRHPGRSSPISSLQVVYPPHPVVLKINAVEMPVWSVAIIFSRCSAPPSGPARRAGCGRKCWSSSSCGRRPPGPSGRLCRMPFLHRTSTQKIARFQF